MRHILLHSIFFVLIFSLILGCENEDIENSQRSSADLCGDGLCDAIEKEKGVCAEDCTVPLSLSKTYDMNTYTYEHVTIETAWTNLVSSTKESETQVPAKGITISAYTVRNPTTAADLAVVVFAPNDASSTHPYPAVILVPGGIGTKNDFALEGMDYASHGFIVLTFDPDGRGESTGDENFNGFAQQDGLYELYRFLSDYEGVDSENIGLVSYSYGITMATGMLARHQPDVKFYIEWEGPVNRFYTTVGCKGAGKKGSAVQEGITCDDDDYWQEREALRFAPYLSADYFLIVQRADDHVQSSVQHSVDINNLAVEYLDWVRVNGPENSVNKKYAVDTLPVLEGTSYNAEILEYMEEIAET